MDARPVVLIDHDQDWCARVCQFLEPHGICVVAAPSVGKAAEHLQHIGAPSALVMDIATRRENSCAVDALRQAESFRNVPVGYVRKAAALDALLLLLGPSADSPHHRAV